MRGPASLAAPTAVLAVAAPTACGAPGLAEPGESWMQAGHDGPGVQERGAPSRAPEKPGKASNPGGAGSYRHAPGNSPGSSAAEQSWVYQTIRLSG